MTLAELVAADMPPTITVDEAADIVGISRAAAYRAVHKGQIPALRIGRRLLVPSASLLEMLGLDVIESDGDVTPHRGDAIPNRPQQHHPQQKRDLDPLRMNEVTLY